jgi:hypothetical protein
MRGISTLIAVILILAPLPPAPAQETPSDWIRRLGSRNYADREKAARALEQLGKPALAALREAMNHADLETKRRAILVMERIEDRLIQEELTQATPVRLRFENMPVDQALREVEKQIGLRCGNAFGKGRISKIDTGVLPYWQAWRKFCSAAQLSESDYAVSSAKLKRMGENDVQQLFGMLNRERIEINSIYAAPRMEFAAAPPFDPYVVDDRHSVRVRLKWHSMYWPADETMSYGVFAIEVRAEPRLEEITTIPRVEITKIVDDQRITRIVQSAKLFPATPRPADAGFLAAYVGEIQYGGLLQFKSVAWPRPSSSLKEVHGHIRMEVAVRPRMMEVPRVLTAVGKVIRGYQGITLKILTAETTEEGDIHLCLHLDHLDSLAPQTPEQQIVRIRPGVIAVRGVMDVAMERLELLDHAGRKCHSIKARYEQVQAGKGYEAHLVFAAPETKADHLTLVMTKASRTVPLEIPFLVRDVVWVQEKDAKGGK